MVSIIHLLLDFINIISNVKDIIYFIYELIDWLYFAEQVVFIDIIVLVVDILVNTFNGEFPFQNALITDAS